MPMFSIKDLKTGKSLPSDAGGAAGCNYAFFNSYGGTSKGHYTSLNVGLHVGDEKFVVLANREIIKAKMGVPFLLSALQVHGTKIHVQEEPLTGDLEVEGYDALITSQKGVALMVQHADCQPVLLYDSVAGVVAAVHNGWRGSVQDILAKVVTVMTRDYSSNPSDLQAIVGPSLGPCCAEFIHYQSELPGGFRPFKVRESHFDFWRISTKQLLDAGLKRVNISVTGECTRCLADYFSYRESVKAATGVTGRNGSVIVLNES